jgi:hypothetical protein
MKARLGNQVPLYAAVIAAALIAGCGSGAQTPLMNNPTAANGSQVLVNPNADRCDDHGGLRVRPCNIVFNANNPGPTNVTVHHNGTIGERDNCAAGGIATIARTGGHTFMVTAGASDGTCIAHFRFKDDNGKVEKGTLTVVNRL